MLIAWENILLEEDQRLLVRIDSQVCYWPCRYVKDSGYHSCIPIEWWILFSAQKYGLIWLLDRSRYSRVVYIN